MNIYIKRYTEDQIIKDLDKKMVFIGGPRQAGKTTLAKKLIKKFNQSVKKRYMNWDIRQNREDIMNEEFPGESGILVLDEIHKYSRWRQTVKGLFDGRGDELKILVTGSARLEHYRHGGDSLQGRYHYIRLFPFTYAELKGTSYNDMEALLNLGGFPDQIISSSTKESKRWSKEYRSRLIRSDLRDLEFVKDINLIDKLSLRLPNLVGSPLSLNAIREDLQVSHESVSRWLNIFENLYIIFRLYPFGAPHIRAVKKEAKHYHYDWNLIKNTGIRIENMVACHLLKWCAFKEDTEGADIELRYFRDIDGREIDFIIVEDNKPVMAIEAKTNDSKVNKSLYYFKKKFPDTDVIQIVYQGKKDIKTKEGIRICPISKFLSNLI